MVLAKDAGLKPRDLAEKIAAELAKRPEITKTEIAGPGFINLTLDPAVWREALLGAIKAGTEYGRGEGTDHHKVNVEYVSANPTGPMHVGHCRGAVFGDALANLEEFRGQDGYRISNVSGTAPVCTITTAAAALDARMADSKSAPSASMTERTATTVSPAPETSSPAVTAR